MKKLRRDRVGVESKDRAKSKAELVMSMDYLAKFPMPFISEYECYCCSKPIDEPIWRGTLNIDGKEYTSLVGHLSTKSGEEVWKLSRSLQTSVEVMKLYRSKARPKIWGSSRPSDDNIGIYFFPHGMRHDADLDELIDEVMKNDLVLQAVIGEAEMLILPSCLLPERYKTFQRKHYLWALFKQKEDRFAVVAKPLNGKAWCVQEEEKGKEGVQRDVVDDVERNEEMILMRSAMPSESQGLVNLHLRMEKQGSEGIARGGMDHLNCKSPAEGTQQASASCVPDATSTGFQLTAPDERKQDDARRHNVHAAAATNSAALTTEATARATNAANVPASHEQFNSSRGVQPGRIIYFVTRQTPRIGQIIEELERENSLVFAMPGEAIGAGSGPGSMVSTMQQLSRAPSISNSTKLSKVNSQGLM